MYANEGHTIGQWGLGTVVLLHLLVFWGLLQMNVIRLPAALAVLKVDLIKPPEEIKPPEPPAPKPRPVEKRPDPPPQPVQLAAPAESPSSVFVSPSPPVVAALPPFAAPPVPVAIVKPRFDADYLDNPKPVYPPLSRRMGEVGRVVLRVQVLVDGEPLPGGERNPATALRMAPELIERIEVKGWRKTVDSDAWNANALPDGSVVVALKDGGLLASSDGWTWEAVPGIAAALEALPGGEVRERITLGKLMTDLHTGKALFGKQMEWIWIYLLGVVWVFLGFTGLWLWWKSQTKRRDAARGRLATGVAHG
ncbi:MAG: hypothetical protein Q8J96_06630 [Rhodocyclaceae bacterium]|nr:hypothetical protein [Rhodocyclaceae bacterium]